MRSPCVLAVLVLMVVMAPSSAAAQRVFRVGAQVARINLSRRWTASSSEWRSWDMSKARTSYTIFKIPKETRISSGNWQRLWSSKSRISS